MNDPFTPNSRRADPQAHQVRIILTATAAREAARIGLEEALTGLELPGNACAGDGVAVALAGRRHWFRLLRRTWVFEGGETFLEFTLDHPARL